MSTSVLFHPFYDFHIFLANIVCTRISILSNATIEIKFSLPRVFRLFIYLVPRVALAVILIPSSTRVTFSPFWLLYTARVNIWTRFATDSWASPDIYITWHLPPLNTLLVTLVTFTYNVRISYVVCYWFFNDIGDSLILKSGQKSVHPSLCQDIVE